MQDPYRGVQAVIEAFVNREVTEKWKQRDTGEPYLNKDQHLRLLADVAEEMYRAQSSSLDIEVVETIATLLLDEWGIDQARSQQILEMVRMHVLLTPPDEEFRRRAFDHEEFQAWFTAYALKDLLMRVGAEGSNVGANLLSVAQLSEATAEYVCALIDRSPDRVQAIVSGLLDLIEHEWRPTYLQPNVGSLIPFLIGGIDPTEALRVEGEVIYASLGLERSRLRSVMFRFGTFVNASFAGADWKDVVFEECNLGEPLFTESGAYKNVVLRDCKIDGIRIVDADGLETHEYAPARIVAALTRLGVTLEQREEVADGEPEPVIEGETRKLVRRVLNLFRRTTIVPESSIQNRFPRDHKRVIDEILPLMVADRLLETKKWRGSGNQRAWGPTTSLQHIEQAEGSAQDPPHEFWSHIDELDGA